MQKSASVTRDALEILTLKTIAEVQLPLMFAIDSFPDGPCCSNPKTGTRLFYRIKVYFASDILSIFESSQETINPLS